MCYIYLLCTSCLLSFLLCRTELIFLRFRIWLSVLLTFALVMRVSQKASMEYIFPSNLKFCTPMCTLTDTLSITPLKASKRLDLLKQITQNRAAFNSYWPINHGFRNTEQMYRLHSPLALKNLWTASWPPFVHRYYRKSPTDRSRRREEIFWHFRWRLLRQGPRTLSFAFELSDCTSRCSWIFPESSYEDFIFHY